MLSNRKSQHWLRSRKIKSERGNIMAELSAFNKFKFFEVLRIQAPYHEIQNLYLFSRTKTPPIMLVIQKKMVTKW